MAETPPTQNRAPEEYLQDARDRLATGGLDPDGMAEVAELALNAAGNVETNVRDQAAVDEMNARLDAVLELVQDPELERAIQRLADRLATEPSLTSEQAQQSRAITALANRSPAYQASLQAASQANLAASHWRQRRGAGGTSSSGSGSSASGGSSSAAAARVRRTKGGPGPGPSAPNTGPAKANTSRDDMDTLSKRFRFLAEKAQAANAQKGNGIAHERNLSVDEAMLREILRALRVNPEVELPITAYRSHPEEGMTGSVEDSLEFIAEARQLWEQLRVRPKVPADPQPDQEIFQYRGPKLSSGSKSRGGPGDSDTISADLVDQLGELTDYSRWIVDPRTQAGFKETLRKLFIAEKNRYLTDGRGGMREPLTLAYEAAGTSRNEKGPRTDPIIRVSDRGPRGAVSADRSRPMWNLDSRLIIFHRAQILKRMQLSNELRIAQRIGNVRMGMIEPGDNPDEPDFEATLDERMTPYVRDITDYAGVVDRNYRNWLHDLYDGIDPRDGTLVMPGSPPRGPGAIHTYNRHPAGVRLYHNTPNSVGGLALVGGDTQVHFPGGSPFAQQPHRVAPRHRSQRYNAAGLNGSPVQDSKLRLQRMYRDDKERRKAEVRDQRSLRQRQKIAGFAGGVLLALPEPIQDRVTTAVQRSTAKRRRRAIPGQSHS